MFDRDKATKYIDDTIGIYNPVWHDWTDEDIKAMYQYVCINSHKEVTKEDVLRVDLFNA